jgi:hypothetical protein
MSRAKGLNERIRELREQTQAAGGIPGVLQGVTKERITRVLRALDQDSTDCCDAVFALLDNHLDSLFQSAPAGSTFCDGASIAHIASHIGVLQRGQVKLDREGRDYWIKPLRRIGAVAEIYLDPKSGRFLPGHPVSKSPNSAYRLNDEFKRILQAREIDWPRLLDEWIRDEALRERLAFQARQAAATQESVNTSNADLIEACCTQYSPRFLPGFDVIFTDDADGDRITEDDKEALRDAGLELRLGDAMPDVLLWNSTTDALWVIEAVTSDGEVDDDKVRRLSAFSQRHGKPSIGFTTAYPTWRVAAQRQGRHKNIAADTFVWIREDGSKHYRAEAFEP